MSTTTTLGQGTVVCFGVMRQVLRMFERFEQEWAPPTTQASGVPPALDAALRAGGFDQFVSRYAGASFASGALRIHTAESSAEANAFVGEMFPTRAGAIQCFAFNCLGQQYALDHHRSATDGESLVLLLVPTSADGVYEVDETFQTFFNTELVDYAEDATWRGLLQSWLTQDDARSLGFDECLSYRVPWFLGGTQQLEDLESSPTAVHWSLTGQLAKGVASQDAGTQITVESQHDPDAVE